MNSDAFLTTLLEEVLARAHTYVPGTAHHRPTLAPAPDPLPTRARDRSRDAAERLAARVGMSRRQFEPEAAARVLAEIVELAPGLTRTYERLADDASRETLLDVLALRVLGPRHQALAITPDGYRARQRTVDGDWRLQRATHRVADPYFPELSLYRVPLANGGSITLHSHSVDIVSVFVLGQYSHPRTAVRPGDTVLDVGGCWGDTALLFAAQAGERGRVYTFEFDPENLAILRENLALNPELARRIEVVEAAVWETSGARLTFHAAGRMTALSGGGGERAAVTTVALDDFCRERELTHLDVVKADVEGAERQVLAGAQRVLDEFAPRLAVAVYHRPDDLVALPAAVPPPYALLLAGYSPVEDETVLYATRENSST